MRTIPAYATLKFEQFANTIKARVPNAIVFQTDAIALVRDPRTEVLAMLVPSTQYNPHGLPEEQQYRIKIGGGASLTKGNLADREYNFDEAITVFLGRVIDTIKCGTYKKTSLSNGNDCLTWRKL